ncbi:MAG: hypothetical protein MHM6MM_005201 [Cercozoa sp. M6MM]
MSQSQPQPRKQVLDLSQLVGKEVRVKLAGGREVSGILKGFDQLMNLVVDKTEESLRDPTDPYTTTGETRTLGLVLLRGTAVMVVTPADGVTEVANPHMQQEEPVIS